MTAIPTSLAERQLTALYEISAVLGRTLAYKESVANLLEVLHSRAGLHHPLLTVLDEQRELMVIDALHAPGVAMPNPPVRYKSGEGIVGRVLAQGEPIVLKRAGDDPRFLDRLELYRGDRPFVAVPIRNEERKPCGVLAAQPDGADAASLPHHLRLLEMVAQLVSQHLRLARQVAQTHNELTSERDLLRRKVRGNYSLDNMVGHTAVMRRVFEQIRLVAKWDSTVLVRGESGTGKELVANAIHYNSPRANGAFIRLNCAALPDNLLESELFGHEKGAFTGAVRDRKGRFELAHRGTIFLDEIGEISPAFQAKLLRVLQEGEFERVGGSQTLQVDVRIIAATNRPLEEAVRAGQFREDLYYRLNVMPIQLPPLRERIEDLPDLTQFLLGRISQQQGRALRLTDSGLRKLMHYSWPGNVRELENLLERAAILSESGVLDQDLLLLEQGLAMAAGRAGPRPMSPAPLAPPPDPELLDEAVDERERVIAALERSGWVQAKAARLLGMTPRQIAYRIQIMNIKMKQL